MNFSQAPGLYYRTSSIVTTAIGKISLNSTGPIGKWTSIAYGNDTYVAVQTATNVLAQSTDGLTWTTSAAPATSTGAIVAFGNGVFVATFQKQGSPYGFASAPIWTSTNGINWTARSAGAIGTSHVWMAVTYTNGKFILASNYSETVTSLDGVTWTSAAAPTGISPYVMVGDGTGRVVMAGGNGTVNLSTNTGSTWANVVGVATNVYWMAYGGSPGAFVTSTTVGTMAGVYVSATGAGGTWAHAATTQPGSYAGVAASATRFVMISTTGTIITSPDGSNWSTVDTTGLTIPSVTWNAVYYDATNSRFVALSNNATVGYALTIE